MMPAIMLIMLVTTAVIMKANTFGLYPKRDETAITDIDMKNNNTPIPRMSLLLPCGLMNSTIRLKTIIHNPATPEIKKQK